MALGVLGIAVSGVIHYRGGSRRRTITIRLMGMSSDAQWNYARQLMAATEHAESQLIIVMKLVIKNRGPQDVAVPDFDSPRWAALRPRIRLPQDFELARLPNGALYQRWPIGESLSLINSEVRLAFEPKPAENLRRPGPLDIWIHIARMNTKTKVQLIFACKAPERLRPLDSTGIPIAIGGEQIAFWHGWILDARVRPKGRYMKTFVRNTRKGRIPA